MTRLGSAPAGGDYDKGPGFITLIWVENAIAFAFVSLRLYTRAKCMKKFWWDDVFIIITMILMIISSSFWTVYSIEGGARHVYYLTLDQGIRASRLNWISQPFTIMALATGKASVAFFLLRILGPSKWRKPFLYFVTISSLIGCGIDSILSFVQCKPVGRLWDSRIDGHCWNPRVQADFALVLAAYLALMDFILALLPITIVYHLQLSSKKKAGIAAILALGVFAGVCAIIKATKLPSLTGRSDFTWLTVSLLSWNNTELFAIVVAASVPAIRPLFLDCSQKVLSIKDTLSRSNRQKGYRISTLPRSPSGGGGGGGGEIEMAMSVGSSSQEAMFTISEGGDVHQQHNLMIRETREWTVQSEDRSPEDEILPNEWAKQMRKDSRGGWAS